MPILWRNPKSNKGGQKENQTLDVEAVKIQMGNHSSLPRIWPSDRHPGTSPSDIKISSHLHSLNHQPTYPYPSIARQTQKQCCKRKKALNTKRTRLHQKGVKLLPSNETSPNQNPHIAMIDCTDLPQLRHRARFIKTKPDVVTPRIAALARQLPRKHLKKNVSKPLL